MLTEKEIAIQCYLSNQESELGDFLLRCITAKIANRLACIKHRLDVRGLFIVTPQEELFASFFNSEKAIVAEMSILELRAHREELAKIAFEARARLTAVDDEERSRKVKKDVTGFSTSVQTDELTTESINRVQQRQKKLNKQEKTIEGLVKMGMDRKDAEKLVSAGTILARVKSMADTPKTDTPVAESKPLINPFAPPVEKATEVTINEETNTVIITKEPEEPPKPFNPFAK